MQKLQELRKHVHPGTILGVLVAIYVAFYLIQTVRHNYQLRGEIGSMQQQLDQLQQQQQAMQYKIQYYQTDSYKEKAARAKLGLQAPGEEVIVLPQTKPAAQPAATKKAEAKKSHWQQWMAFLAGRS